MSLLSGISSAVGIAQGIGSFFGSGGGDDYHQLNHRKQRETDFGWDKRVARDLPQHQRWGFEKAGINPQTGMGVAPPSHGYTPTFGSNRLEGLAAASETLLGIEALELQRAELEQETERLQEQSEDLKLSTPGNQIQRRTRPNAPDSRPDNSDADTDGSAVDSLGSLGEHVAPGREVKVQHFESGPGLTEINNRATFGPVVVPGADGEPWGVDELATGVVFGFPQVAANAGGAIKERFQKRKHDKAWERWVGNEKRAKDPKAKKRAETERKKLDEFLRRNHMTGAN